MRMSAFCAAVLTYVVIGHPPPAGWVVREGARRGDYEVVQQQP